MATNSCLSFRNASFSQECSCPEPICLHLEASGVHLALGACLFVTPGGEYLHEVGLHAAAPAAVEPHEEHCMVVPTRPFQVVNSDADIHRDIQYSFRTLTHTQIISEPLWP
jgi:hypothetical protein